MTEMINRKYNDRINKFCSAFFSSLNLCHFWYFKINNTGNVSFVGSFAEWTEIFAAEGLYKAYLFDPKFFKAGITLRKNVQNPYLQKVCLSWEKKFGDHQTLVFHNKTSDGFEEFGFTSPSSSDNQTGVFLNELPIFRLIIQKFKEEKKFLSQLEEIQINVVSLIGPDFYTDRLIQQEKVNRQSIFKNWGVKADLSPIERKLIPFIALGYSAEKIALKIFRSKRTVEHHVERIKMKLECDSKFELVQKARQLEDIGYFIEIGEN